MPAGVQTESGVNHDKLRKMIETSSSRIVLNLNQLRKVDPELTYGCVCPPCPCPVPRGPCTMLRVPCPVSLWGSTRTDTLPAG